MQTKLDIVDELATSLASMLPLKPENQKKLDKKLRLEFNYNSNHLEGNTLTYGETELLLIFDDAIGNHTYREYEEMKAHDVAYQLIFEWATDNERPLTEQNIKNLNEIMLVRPFWKDAITADGQPTRRQIEIGNYKNYPNSVRLQNGEIFEYTSPAETPIKMRELIEWYRTEQTGLHPVTLAALFHHKFVCIHPFDDGNGRVSRLLMNYVLLKNGLPSAIIKSADKRNYLSVLHQADIGNYEPFIEYIANQVIWSLELYLKAARGESLEDADDFIKEIDLIKKKTLTSPPSKSPKIVHEICSVFQNDLWVNVEKMLGFFDELFQESKTSHYVNFGDEKFEIASPSDAIKLSLSLPNNSVFGFDIYEKDLKEVKWSQTKYGLKGGSEAKFEISLVLQFSADKYYCHLSLNESGIYSFSKPYNDLLLSTQRNEMIEILKTKMLSGIKGQLEK